MPSVTLSEVLDNLYTTTWQNMKNSAADNVFDATPFWFWMKENGRLKEQRGGRWIGEPVIYDDNDNVTWLTKGATTPLNDYEFMTTAKYDWRYVGVPIVRFGIDDQQNSGKHVIMNYMQAKLENAKQSLISTMETQLAAGSGSATNKFDGLQWLIADDPTSSSNTVGGLDPSSGNFTTWRNQTSNMSSVSFATSGVDRMRTMFNNCSNNRSQDAPDFILTSQTVFEYYEDQGLTPYRINNNKLADMGFENIAFKGVPMVWSPAISQRMYFLNTRHIWLVYDPIMFFDMTEWKAIPNQVNDRVAQIATACQLVTNRRKVHGVIRSIDTA